MSNEKKLGPGIITMSVIFLVLAVLTVIGSVFSIFAGDTLIQSMVDAGQLAASEVPSKTTYIINLIVSLFTVLFVILILCKNKIGVIGYFVLTILSNVYSLIITGVSGLNMISQLIGFAIIALYAFFIYKKRDIYGFTKETIDQAC